MTAPRFLPESRLDVLRRYGILDTAPEKSFDRITRLTAQVMSVPVSLISFVDETRQFFKSSLGLAEPWAGRRETPPNIPWREILR